ncbi:IS607 family element RNA-guided endonuclease TnpB [Spirillospora sp. CA-253888]
MVSAGKNAPEGTTARVHQAYRFALDPNAAQEAALRSHCGAARTAYNWAVAHVTATWRQRMVERSYGVPEELLTPWRSWSPASLRREFNRIKRTDPRFAGWWAENSKEAYNTGFSNAASAFENYAASRSGRRGGAKTGAPRPKRKRGATMACRFTTGAIRVEDDRRHVTLPRIGTIRTHENTRSLQRRLADGRARVLSVTVRYERGRWFAAFQVEVRRNDRRAARPRTTAGVDLGVRHLAVIADDTGRIRMVPNPRPLEEALTALRHLSRTVSRRRGPDRRAGRAPSRRWEKANARRNRLHHRVANLRADAVHKLTTGLATEYGRVVIEDLYVAGMAGNRRLARQVADAAFGEIRRRLEYKIAWRGGELLVADRWFPSSKTCSGCGAAKAKLPPRVRVYECGGCALVLDRDVNAARDLAALAACSTGTGVAGVPGAQAPNARGADRETRVTRPAACRAGRAGGARPARRRGGTEHRQADRPARGGGGTDLPDGDIRDF